MLLKQIELRSYNTELCRHSHDYAQLVLPILGTMDIEIGNREGAVNMETAAFIPSGEQHCFAGSHENLFAVVDLPHHATALNSNSFPHFFNLTATTKNFLEFTHYYLIENQIKNYSSDSLIQNLLLNLISQPLLPEHDRFVTLAKNWISLYFACPIDIVKLAQHCHLSASQLQRRFKRSTGYGIAEYWRSKRLEQAKRLLSEQNHSIEAIGFKIGYENASVFSRCFHKSFGVSPSQWRTMTLNAKNMRGKDNIS